MSEQQTGTNPQAGEEPTGQEPTPTGDGGQQPTPADGSDKDTGNDDSGKGDDERVTKANREAAKYRTELRKAQEKLEQLERERMTEAERAQADAAKAKEQAEATTAKARAALGKAALTAAAATEKLIDPSIVHDLLAGRLEFDDDGEPTNAADLVKQLVADKPYLVNQGGAYAGGAPGAAAPGQQPAKQQSREDFLADFGLLR